MPSQSRNNKQQGEATLASLRKFRLSFTGLMDTDEASFAVDDCAQGTEPLLDLAFTLHTRLADLDEHIDYVEEMGERYTVAFAKKTWLDMIATYCGIIPRRIARGEMLFESEPVTAKLREEVAALRLLLLRIYPVAHLEALEERERVERDED